MGTISFGTASVLCTCVTLWVVPALLGGNIGSKVCLMPKLVVENFQIWRIWLYTIAHQGFFHILFNMITWYFLGSDYESQVGSLGLLYDVFIRILPFASVTHIILSYLLDSILSLKLHTNCCVGISGVLFALLVYQLRNQSTVSVLGFFDMPSIWYPPLLALLLQLFYPQISFLGHITGILAGHALTNSLLDVIQLPTPTREWLELHLKHLPRWNLSPGYLSFLTRPEPPSFQATVSNARNSVSQWWTNSTANMNNAGTSTNSTPSAPGESRPGRAIFSSSTTSTAAAFSGTGHVVGGSSKSRNIRTDTETPRTGVPSHSRLLQQPPPKVAKKTTQDQLPDEQV